MRECSGDTDRLTPELVRRIQQQKLASLLSASWSNPFYRSIWQGAGLVKESTYLSDLDHRLPTITKADFLRDQEAFPPYGERNELAVAKDAGKLISMTSGSSGRGQELQLQTAEELAITGEVYAYGYRWAGLKPGDVLAMTMPITLLGGGRLEAAGADASGLCVLPLGNYPAEEKLEYARRLNATAFIGTTSYLGRLASIVDDSSRPPTLKAIMTGGEGGGLGWMRTLGDRWGAKVFDRYGSSQAGSDHMFSCDRGIGTPEEPGVLHNIDTHVLLEVVDPRTGRQVSDGELGEIVVTVLYRHDTPVIRYAMGDQAVFRAPGMCACGSPFSGVEAGSISRIDDVKKIKGINVWPQLLDDVVLDVQGVSDYQLHLETGPSGEEKATLMVAIDDRLAKASDEIRQTVFERTQRSTGIRCRVVIEPPERFGGSDWKATRIRDDRDHVTAAT